MEYVVIESAVPADLLTEIHQAINFGPFDDGKGSASGLARRAKSNQQLSCITHGELLDRVGSVLVSHAVVRAYAMPCQIGRPILNRYEAGMEYGMHVDGAYIGDLRTDISFTLFLDEPEAYDGGELIVSTPSQQFTFKLAAGAMVLYPTGYLHAVTAVSRGVRHAVVGWIQSRVRDPEQRTILAKLNAVTNSLGQDEKQAALALQVAECTQNLTRMWGE